MRRLRTLDPTVVPRVLLVVGISLSVVAFDLKSVKPFGVVKMVSLWAFVWLAGGIWLIEVLRGRSRVQGSRLIWYVLAFVAAAGLATLFSITPVVSFFGEYARYSGFVQSVMYAALFFLVGQLYWRRPERLKEIIYALGISALIASIYLLLQWRGFDPLEWRDASGREATGHFHGTLGNTNFAGGYLGATFPWLFFAFRDTRRVWLRMGVVLLVPLTVLCVILTGSRGGVLALAGSSVVGVLGYRRLLSKRIMIVGVALAIAALSALSVLAVRTPEGVTEVTSEVRAFRIESLRNRVWWWGAALKNFADHPILGTGPDTFVVVWPRNAPLDSAGVADAEDADQPHSVPLGLASGMGILGLGAYLFLIGTVFAKALARLPVADRTQGALLVTFLAVASGYLAQSVVSIDMTPIAMTGWVSLGALAVLCDPRLARAREGGVPVPTGRPRSMLRWSGIAVVAGATTFLVAMGVRAWVADRSMRVNPLASITQLRARLDRGIALNPYEPIYRGIAGDALVKNAAVNPDKEAKTAILVEAVDRLKEMDELQPGHHLWKITVGDALGRLGETGELGAFAESEIWFSEALDLSHADWRVPARYGEMLNRWGTATGDGTRFCQALEQFDRALSLRITDASTHLGAGISHAYLGHLDRAEQHLRFAARIWRMHPNPSSEEVIAGKRAVITLRSVEQLRKEPPKSRACT